MKIPNSVALAPVASLNRSRKKIDTAGPLVCQPKFEVHDMKGRDYMDGASAP